MYYSSTRVGNQPVTVASFRQMCGRAGRLGLSSFGEAILMVEDSKAGMNQAAILLTAPLPPLRSCLDRAEGGGLEKYLLELVSCDRLCNIDQVDRFVAATLFHAQETQSNVRVVTVYVFFPLFNGYSSWKLA
jgi:replicative superfamily II helicase